MFANDVPGVMADITSTLAKHQISIEAVTQHEPFENEKLIPVVMITNSVMRSLSNFGQTDGIYKPPSLASPSKITSLK